jgi:hypothetical protein
METTIGEIPIAPMWPCLAAACQPGRGDYIDMRRLRAYPGSPGSENFQMVPQPPLPERAVNFHTLCSCAYIFPSESNVKGTPKSTPFTPIIEILQLHTA